MKHCKHCGVDVSTPENYCPLCYNYLEEDDKKDNENFSLYLSKNKFEKNKFTGNFLKKLFIFLSLAISIITVFLNYFLQKHIDWSLVVVFSLLYVWVIVSHTITSERNVFEKIFFQLIALIALLWSLNNIAKGDWLFNYVLPSIMIASSSCLIVISIVSKNRQNYVLSFLTFYLIFIIVSLVFLIFVKNVYHLLNYINLIYNVIASIGTLFFGFKTIKTEIAKKMHL